MAIEASPPSAYVILDLGSGNKVASYDDEAAAVESLREMTEAFPRRAEHLALVFFDKEGRALETYFVEDLVS